MKDGIVDFIGIGAPKSGSTWISACLEEHPEVDFAPGKELNFFVDKYFGEDCDIFENGIEWYQKQIPKTEGKKVRGEFSVSYYADPIAVPRIKEYFPDAKLLMTMRAPADMLYSQYWYVKMGINGDLLPDTFEEFLQDKKFIDAGFYYEKLSHVLKHFDKEKVFITTLDDIKADSEKLCRELYSFIGVDEDFRPTVLDSRVNQAKVARFRSLNNFLGKFSKFVRNHLPFLYRRIFNNQFLFDFYRKYFKKDWKYPPMKDEVRSRVKAIFADDIKRLEGLLGKELKGWY